MTFDEQTNSVGTGISIVLALRENGYQLFPSSSANYKNPALFNAKSIEISSAVLNHAPSLSQSTFMYSTVKHNQYRFHIHEST